MKKRSRSNGEGSVYRRKNGLWCATYWHDGRRRECTALSEKRAREKRDQARENALRGVIEPSKVLLKDFLTMWIEKSVPLTCGPQTVFTYRGLIDRHIAPSFLGAMRLDKLSKQHVSAWVLEMKEKHVVRGVAKAGKAPEGAPLLSPSRVHGCWRVLRAALNVAKDWKLIPENPAKVRMKQVPRSNVATLNIADAGRLLEVVSGRRLEALWALAVCVGMRKGELLGLRVSDVDLENGWVHVRKQLQRVGNKTLEYEPKAGSRRSLRLPAFVVPVMAAHLERRRAESIEAGEEWSESGRCFCTRSGTAISARSLGTMWAALRAVIGRPELRLHDLRHSAATLLHINGVEDTAIQAMLGHSSINTTRQVYLHRVPESEQRTAGKMDDLLGGKKRKGKKAA